jgi:hypothetical protein
MAREECIERKESEMDITVTTLLIAYGNNS